MTWQFLPDVSVSLPRTSTMGFQHISRDVKIAAIRLHEQDLLELDDILNLPQKTVIEHTYIICYGNLW